MKARIPAPTYFEKSVTKEVDKIIKPIKNLLGINYFNMTKLYWNSKGFCLSNSKEWLEYFEQHKLNEEMLGCPIPIAKNLFCENELDKNTPFYKNVIQTMNEKFDFTQLCTVAFYHAGATCLYSFGVPSSVKNFTQTFLTNQDYIKQFTYYFSEKGSNLLERARKNAQLIDISAFDPQLIKNTILDSFKEKFDKFNSLPKTKRYYMHGEYDELYLTKQEYKSLRLLLRGYPFTQIASQLNISEKTAYEYITNVKTKLGCQTKSELLRRFVELDIMPREFDTFSITNSTYFDERSDHYLAFIKKNLPDVYLLLNNCIEELKNEYGEI